jgi:tRNA pseudouridine38-40 synthase
MRYFLHIGYDGTNYRGWQRQAEAKSVQETIEKFLSQIIKSTTTVYGCGRTDAGVHASQYLLHINLDNPISFDLKFRLNKNLPDSIVVYDVIKVEDRQHARFDAVTRTYDYFIHFHSNPVLNKYSTLYEIENLNFENMKLAASMLTTGKDFRHFCKQPDIHNNTLCTVSNAKISVTADQNRLHFSMTANRFLRGMMRIIVTCLIQVGTGELSIEDFQAMLDQSCDESEKQPAHPNGLFLSKIEYPFLNLPERENICSLLKLGY